MKMALYVENDITQFVLTPQTDWEKRTLADLTDKLSPKSYPSFERKSIPAKIFGGEFYPCQGGWVRQGSGTDSLIVRFDVEAAVDD